MVILNIFVYVFIVNCQFNSLDLLLNFDRKKEERKKKERKKKDNSPLLELLGFAATKKAKRIEYCGIPPCAEMTPSQAG